MKYEQCEGCPGLVELVGEWWCQEAGTTIADIDECPCKQEGE